MIVNFFYTVATSSETLPDFLFFKILNNFEKFWKPSSSYEYFLVNPIFGRFCKIWTKFTEKKKKHEENFDRVHQIRRIFYIEQSIFREFFFRQILPFLFHLVFVFFFFNYFKFTHVHLINRFFTLFWIYTMSIIFKVKYK